MKQGLRVQLLALAILGVCAGITVAAQNVRKVPAQEQRQANIGMVQDWSSRHVMFTGVKTYEETVAANLSPARWERLASDPRFVMALTKRFKSEADNQSVRDGRRGHETPSDAESETVRDWSAVLGGGNAALTPADNALGGRAPEGMYPAKYNFNVEAAPDCANDFIVYPTNTRGATSSGSAETRTSSFSQRPGNGDLITIGATGTPRSIQLTAVGTLSADPLLAARQFERGPNVTPDNATTNATEAATAATNLAAAVNRWTGQTGIAATPSAGNVTFRRISNSDTVIIPITDGLGNYTVSATEGNGGGTAGQPTIIAFNQLYNTTCNSGQLNPGQSPGGRTNNNAPNVLWSYNTGTNFITETSPVLSYYDNGKQVAFVQRNSQTNVVQLVLLKGLNGSGTAGVPTALTSISAAAYRAAVAGQTGCVNGCMTTFVLDNASPANTPTYSSPFVDYRADILWVGDGNGRLHKFTGVFRTATPTQVTTGGYPVTVAPSGLALSPPAYDFAGNVWVGSESGTGTDGGKVHRVNVTSTPVVTDSAKLSDVSKTGVRAGPVIDIGRKLLYAFVFSVPNMPDDPARCDHQTGGYIYCRAVIQFSTTNAGFPASPAPAPAGTKMAVGLGSISSGERTLWMGAFDDAYYAGTGNGAMYICGGNTDRTQNTRLWKIPFNSSGVMQNSVAGRQIGADDDATNDPFYDCSATSYIKNGSNEFIYMSISGSGIAMTGATGCGAATDTDPLSQCLYAFNLGDLNGSAAGTGTAWGTSTTGTTANNATAALQIYGGTSSIVVDNISGTTGASQIYFSHRANGGNAVQVSQSTLQ